MSGLFGALAKATSAFWGPVAGAAVGVIGGLAVQNKASRDAAAAEKRNQEYLNDSKLNDLSKLRESAQKAGFNPLTALRSGAGNFQSNTALMPSMSGYQFAIESLATGVEKAVQWKQTYQDRALDTLLKTYQIKGMQADIALTKGQLKNLGVSSKDTGPLSVPLYGADGKKITDGNGNTVYVPAEANEVIPKYKLVYDQKSGGTYAIVNPELTESGLTELVTGLGMDAAGQAAAQTGQGMSFKGFGFAADPFGLNNGVRSVHGNNMTYARPKLSF